MCIATLHHLNTAPIPQLEIGSHTCFTMLVARSWVLNEVLGAADSAFELSLSGPFKSAPFEGFTLMGALAVAFNAVLVLELSVELALDAANASDVSDLVSDFTSAGTRCRRSAWPAPCAGCASRST